MSHNDDKKLQIVGIYVWHGKAYLPTQARFETGIFVDIDPVYIVEISKDGLSKAITHVKDAGHGYLPPLTDNEEFLSRKDPLLSASGARSWKQLARTGASYTIAWTKEQVRVDMSRIDKKGRWEYDLAKTQILPPDTPLERIIEVILDDVKTRPEVFE